MSLYELKLRQDQVHQKQQYNNIITEKLLFRKSSGTSLYGVIQFNAV